MRAAGQARRGVGGGEGRTEHPDDAAARMIPDPGAFKDDDPRILEAHRRLAIVHFAEDLEASWVARAAAVAAEVAAPTREMSERLVGPAPSRQTLQRWVEEYQAAGRQLGALIPLPSTGRNPDELHADVEEHLLDLIRTYPNKGAKAIHAKLASALDRRLQDTGIALPLPSRDKVRRFKRAIPLDDLLLSNIGTKGSRARTAIKATFPTNAANDLWMCDGLHFRSLIRIWDDRDPDPNQHKWIEARPHGVIVQDAHSRLPLSHWVKEPTSAKPKHTAFTAKEVIAVVAAGVFPELAHPEFKQFAIGQPKLFRCDGSGEMASARLALKKQGWPVLIGEPNAAWKAGRIERLIGTLKRRELAEITGSSDVFVVFDPDAEDPRTVRSRENADSTRVQPVKHEIPVECLPTIEQFRALVAWALNSFLNTPSRALHRQTPLSVWRKTAPAPQDTVTALISEFPTHSVQVTSSGIELGDDKYNAHALHEVFENRQKVFVRADPLKRGVFVYPSDVAARVRSQAVFVPNVETWARTLDPKEFAKESRASFTPLRESVYASRGRVLSDEIGREAYDAVQRQKTERAEKQQKSSRRAKAAAKRQAKGEQQDLPLDMPPPQMDRVSRALSPAPSGAPTAHAAPVDEQSVSVTPRVVSAPPTPALAAPRNPAPHAAPAAAPAPAVTPVAVTLAVGVMSSTVSHHPASDTPEAPRVLPFRARARRPLFTPRFVDDAAALDPAADAVAR